MHRHCGPRLGSLSARAVGLPEDSAPARSRGDHRFVRTTGVIQVIEACADSPSSPWSSLSRTAPSERSNRRSRHRREDTRSCRRRNHLAWLSSVERLRRGDSTALATFWARAASERTPIIETIPGDSARVLATFVYRDATPLSNVVISGGVAGWVDALTVMEHVAGTDLWYKTVPVRKDIRIWYQFRKNDSLFPWFVDPNFAKRWAAGFADPLNPKVEVASRRTTFGIRRAECHAATVGRAPAWGRARPADRRHAHRAHICTSSATSGCTRHRVTTPRQHGVRAACRHSCCLMVARIRDAWCRRRPFSTTCSPIIESRRSSSCSSPTVASGCRSLPRIRTLPTSSPMK